MDPMDPAVPPPPPAAEPAGPVACKRHPNVQTRLRCVRCGDPICPDCMRPAAVGYQCPSCARESRQEVHQPGRQIGATDRRATLTNALLLILVAAYGIEVAFAGVGSLVGGPLAGTLVRLGASLGYGCTRSGDLIGIGAGQYWRLGSEIFLHAGLLHLAMNGYALWIFGNVVERELGRSRFLAIFVVGGLFASAASFVFGDPFTPGVGASGAIFAIFGAFAGYSWRRRQLAFYAARIRNAITLIIINAVFSLAVPGIDWRAHLGGLVGGVVLGLAADGLGQRGSRVATFVAAAAVLAVATALGVAAHAAALRDLYGTTCG
jgi:membrane associated rhomboid family serine protease